MKRLALPCPVLWLAAGVACAAVPPAQNLLPDDTLLLLTVPASAQARSTLALSSQVQFWNDPAMKPFRERFMTRWTSEVLAPLERDLDMKLADYYELAQGQFTFAVIRNGWNGGTNPQPARVILLDAASKSDQLSKDLADLRNKWSATGKQVRVEKVRDVEFSVLGISASEISSTTKRVFGDTNTAPVTFEPEDRLLKQDVFIGQSGSLLLIGDNSRVLERILARLGGSQMSSLSDQAAYESAHNALFRDALAFGWLDAKSYLGALSDEAARDAESDAGPTLFPPMNKILTALGLAPLKTIGVSIRANDDGTLVQVFLGAPASERTGLLKILAVEDKEATPPAFVPADVVKFERIRADLPAVWAELESLLGKFAPSGSETSLRNALDVVGKDTDPNFDFRKTLLAGLGDDIINYQRVSKGNTVADLNDAPSLWLLGSPNTDQLLLAIKALTSILPPQIGGGTEVKDREFLGRRIYSLVPPRLDELGVTGSQGLHFAASGGYLALSGSPALVEEYLRSSESQGKALRDRAGLLEAAQKVGGPGTGLFGFSDEAEKMRVLFEALRKDPQNADRLRITPANPLDPDSGEQHISRWFDFSLLPEFSQVAKYFHFTVHAASANDAGLSLNFYSPRPPELKK